MLKENLVIFIKSYLFTTEKICHAKDVLVGLKKLCRINVPLIIAQNVRNR